MEDTRYTLGEDYEYVLDNKKVPFMDAKHDAH
jgi:hypothetical protein